MNWYIEKDGVSQGPLTEEMLALRVQGGEVASETLIWHVGLKEWQPVAQLRPQWLVPVTPAKSAPAASDLAPAPAPAPASGPAPSSAGPKLVPIPAAAPSRPVAKPLAPSVADEQTGFFKKLFGRLKKKP